jgi:hypothetical protein
MKSERERAQWMFELLAALHLHELRAAGEGNVLTPRLERTLAGMQRMPAEDWEQLLKFAELQRVRLRTLHVLSRWVSAGALRLNLDRLDHMILEEERRNRHALAALQRVIVTLEQTGHTPIVIKTLDHWPDIGSDLDLFTSASEQATVAALRDELHAEVQPQSWGDRLAHKWNFRIPDLPQLVEIHIGRLGQTGEQHALPEHLEQTSMIREAGPFEFRVPAPEEQVTLATLQRMYRHFYIRLTDVLNLTRLVREGRLDFVRLRNSANRWSIWPGAATLLRIASDANERAGAGALPLPQFVIRDARFRANVTFMGEQFLRVPMMPQGFQLFLQQMAGAGATFDIPALARLSLFPALAAAAFVNLRMTGSDKGIW